MFYLLFLCSIVWKEKPNSIWNLNTRLTISQSYSISVRHKTFLIFSKLDKIEIHVNLFKFNPQSIKS